MFDDLTITELDELADALDKAIYDVTHDGPIYAERPVVVAELEATEHEVWHTRCVKSNVRCMHRHDTEGEACPAA